MDEMRLPTTDENYRGKKLAEMLHKECSLVVASSERIQ